MQEITEEIGSEQPDFARYADVARRRLPYFLIPFFFGWLIVWGASWLIHPKYKSSVLILVEQPTMPKDYVAPNVSTDLQDKMQSMTKQIMSRTRLLVIIQKLHLYEKPGKVVADDDKVDRMRKDIDIELVRDARNQEITAFRILYSAPNPQLAQAVTSELKDLFINETLRVRQQESEGTTKFIQAQLDAASEELRQQEAKVEAYKATHEGALPQQEASNLQILSGLQAQMQNQQDSLNAARQQRTLLESQIQQYRTARASSKPVDGVPTGVSALDAQLSTLRAQLVDLSARYTDSYPDVKKLKQQIAETQRQRDQLMASTRGSGGDAEGAAPGSPQAMLESQLQANKLEISNRESAINGLQLRINQYEARLNETPATDSQLAELNRGYDQSKANYADLLKKKNESEMATSMEQMQQGERFTMLDPPSLPIKPDFPNHLKFCGMGLGVGFALGVLIAGILEFLDDRLYSERQIKDLLPVSVIAEIPEVVNVYDEEQARRKLILNWAMAAVVVLSVVAGAAFSYLRG